MSRYHDLELSEAERSHIAAHLQDCRSCADALAHLQHVDTMLHEALTVLRRCPATVHDRMMARVSAEMSGAPLRRRTLVPVAMTAGGLGVAAGFLLAIFLTGGRPSDMRARWASQPASYDSVDQNSARDDSPTVTAEPRNPHTSSPAVADVPRDRAPDDGFVPQVSDSSPPVEVTPVVLDRPANIDEQPAR